MSQHSQYSGGVRPYGEKGRREQSEGLRSQHKPIPQDRIAEAAYYRWQREGGDAESNWYAAERELQKSIAGRASDENE
jgi:hypothetical protein